MFINDLIFLKGKVNTYIFSYNKEVNAHLYFYIIYIKLINKEYIKLFLISESNNLKWFWKIFQFVKNNKITKYL